MSGTTGLSGHVDSDIYPWEGINLVGITANHFVHSAELYFDRC